MANDIEELIQLQERLYCKLSDPQEKLIVRNYIENLKREKSKLDFLNNMKISTKGKLEFTRHVLDVCLEKTNEELRNLGMIDFMFTGYAAPVESMPQIIRLLANLIPAHHWLDIVRGIMLKGSGFMDILPSVAALLILGIIIVTFSMRFIRRALD